MTRLCSDAGGFVQLAPSGPSARLKSSVATRGVGVAVAVGVAVGVGVGVAVGVAVAVGVTVGVEVAVAVAVAWVLPLGWASL